MEEIKMRQVQLINVNTNEVTAFPILKSAAEFIESANITDNSIKTIQTKLSSALKNDEVLYETYKIVEVTDEPNNVEENNEVTEEVTEENTEVPESIVEDKIENETNNTVNEN